MALTDRAAKAAGKRKTAYRISDSPGGVKGLNIKITPAGQKSWVLRYLDRNAGRERFHTFGSYPSMSLADAREEARRLKERAQQGQPLVPDKDSQAGAFGTVQQLLSGYWTDLKDQDKTSWSQVQSRCKKHVIPHIGAMIAKDVTEDEVIAVLSRIYQSGHRPMANRVRSYLQTAWKWGKAHDRDYRFRQDGIRFSLGVNPVADIPRDKKAEQVDDRALDWHEIKAMFYACQDVISLQMRLACQLLVVTGQRPGEVIGIHDSELNLSLRVWNLPGSRTKNGQDHIIPLCDMALSLINLARKYKGKSKYLFPKRVKPGVVATEPMREDSLYTAVTRYCVRTGIEPWTPNNLRTTFKTRGGEIGLSKEIRDRIQNHAFSDVGSRHYDMWSYLPEKRSAMDEWERRLLLIL
jgi:integrase